MTGELQGKQAGVTTDCSQQPDVPSAELETVHGSLLQAVMCPRNHGL